MLFCGKAKSTSLTLFLTGTGNRRKFSLFSDQFNNPRDGCILIVCQGLCAIVMHHPRFPPDVALPAHHSIFSCQYY